MKKNTLIFGSTRGIGRQIKKKFEETHNVVGLSRQAKNIDNFIPIDLGNLENLIKDIKVKLKYKKIDNLIFSQRYRGDQMIENFNVSLFSIKKIIDYFENKFSKNGSIVIIISQGSDLILNDHDVDYHLIHSALKSLTRFYAVKLGKKNIRVNAVSTVTIIKPENKKFYNASNKITKLIKKITPLKRMGSADDVANAAEFLCSDKSNFITGQIIEVNGGINLMSNEAISKKYFLK